MKTRGLDLQRFLQSGGNTLSEYGCWWFEDVNQHLQGHAVALPCKHLIVFESAPPDLAKSCWKLFRAIQHVKNGGATSVALQVSGAADDTSRRLLRMMFYAATCYGSVASWSLTSVKFVTAPSSHTSSTISLFRDLVTAYETPPVSIPRNPDIWEEDPNRRERALKFFTESSDQSLTRKQCEMLWVWTGNTIFKSLATVLYAENIDSPAFKYFQPTIEGISSALVNLPDLRTDNEEHAPLRGTTLHDDYTLSGLV